MRTVYSLIVILFFTSCSETSSKKVQESVKKGIIAKVKKIDTTRVINDEYISSILAWNYPCEKIIKTKGINKNFKIVPNDYDSLLHDTIATFRHGDDYFTYYISGDSTVTTPSLIEFTIKSASINLPFNIHTSMTKNDMIRKLNVINANDALILSEAEGYQKLLFLFEKEKLVTITFKSTYLD